MKRLSSFFLIHLNNWFELDIINGFGVFAGNTTYNSKDEVIYYRKRINKLANIKERFYYPS
jgi:hypothetical protein